jgi:phi LC3 family holin
MLVEFLYELKDQIDRHGIRWGVIFTLFVVYRKELRNKRLDLRDDAMFINQRIIMDHLGIGDQYHGQPIVSHKDLANYKPLQQYCSEVIQWAKRLRRKNAMNKVNWLTLVPAVVGTLKLVLQPFGIDLSGVTDEHVNSIVNGAAALATIIGVFMNHYKKGAADSGSNAQRPTDSNSAV